MPPASLVVDLRRAMARCEREQGLATTAVLAAGGVGGTALWRATADGDLVRVRRAVYALGPLPAWPRYVVTETGVAADHVLHVRAVLLSLGDHAVARRRTAAALRGWGLLVEPARTVEVAVPHGHSRTCTRGVDARQVRHLESELCTPLPGTAPLRLTSAPQTAVDCLVELPLLQAVVAVDSALRARDVSLLDLQDAVRSLPGRRDADRARRALALCDPESGSVLESVLRVRMVQAGVEGFSTQRTLRTRDGGYLLRVDFCFEEVRLVVEADGARWHPDPGRDRAKDNDLAAAGWRVLRFTWSEVMHEPARVLALIRAATTA